MSDLVPVYADHVKPLLERAWDEFGVIPPWEAINTAVDLICANPTAAQAQSIPITLASGRGAWHLPLRDSGWVLIWWHTDIHALIGYIGPTPKR